MAIYRVKLTAKREGSQITTVSEEIMERLPDDPHYWDAAAKYYLNKMIAEGVLPSPDKEASRK